LKALLASIFFSPLFWIAGKKSRNISAAIYVYIYKRMIQEVKKTTLENPTARDGEEQQQQTREREKRERLKVFFSTFFPHTLNI
jgi:hypothetical protein